MKLEIENTVEKRLQSLSGIFFLTTSNIRLLVNLWYKSKELNKPLLDKEVKKAVTIELELKNKYQLNQYLTSLRKKKAIVGNKLHPMLDVDRKQPLTIVWNG